MAEGVQFSRYLGKRAASMAEYAPDPLEVVAAHLGMLVGQLIKLDANENPFGPSRRALQAIIGYNAWQEYPDPISRQLRSAIGSYLRVDAARVMVGNGSDELIDQIVTLFRPEAGVGGIREVLSFPPTFGMYKHYTAVNDMQLVEIPRDSAFQLDMAAIERLCSDGQPRLCFVASPNNPDGQLLPKSTLTRLLELPLLVVLDEAYVEFSERSAVALTKSYDNLIVLRTFSKWAGLAGLRVGYGVFPPDLMSALERIKSPYNVNGLAQAAALATLEDLPGAMATVQRIIAEREKARERLETLPFLRLYPSQANYLFCKVVGIPMPTLRKAMEARGIILRYYPDSALDDCVRITIGTPSQNDAVWVTLRELANQEVR